MSSVLPIGMELLLAGGVEGVRLELKASWDEVTTGPQIISTLCAFANDLQNLNGGYVVLGVAEVDGVAQRPVRGVPPDQIDAAQKWLRGHCNTIEPVYVPVFDTVSLDGKLLLVLWAPASDNRPHQAPDAKNDRKYWVRIGSEKVAAKGEVLTRLLQQTARIPFDDRRAFEATNEDLRISLAREFLRDVTSELLQEPDAERTYAAMQITRRQNGHTVPRNVGLLFFSDRPDRWFRGACIELVEFADDAGGDTIQEHVFRGPLHHQLRQCLTMLESLTVRHLQKRADVPKASGWVSYPLPALREAVVNAIYHRSYEDVVEPTKVYLYPNRIEVISYPGPVDGITLEDLRENRPSPHAPARNRRIGELLKELGLAEGRGTGLPRIYRSMGENGSPRPQFSFDSARTWFSVTLPAHPEYLAWSVLRDYAYRRATGDEAGATRILTEAWTQGQRSPALATELVRARAGQGDLPGAQQIIADLPGAKAAEYSRAIAALASELLDAGRKAEAREVLDRLPESLPDQDAIEAAIAERRAGRQKRAHGYFLAAGEIITQDVRALHEFAQTKMALTAELHASKRSMDQETRSRLLKEAIALLERVVQMQAPPARLAWAWFNLGQARRWLRRPRPEVREALARAVALLPGEERFQRELDALG